jgi:hypothetical protein
VLDEADRLLDLGFEKKIAEVGWLAGLACWHAHLLVVGLVPASILLGGLCGPCR